MNAPKLFPNIAESARQQMRKIQENQRIIDACPKHDFGELGKPEFGMVLKCFNCKSEMKAIDAFRYCQGFAAAGGDPNEVIRNFAEPKPAKPNFEISRCIRCGYLQGHSSECPNSK